MNKLYTFFCLLLLVSSDLFATYSTDWIRPADNYMKNGTMIARDKSDNVIVTGYIQTNNIFTRKYDKFGNFLWEQVDSSGIQSNYEKPSWVNCDKNKNVYVVGYRYSWGSSWEYPNAVIVIKYNASGALMWRQVIPLAYVVGSSSGFAFNMKSEIDANGNVFIGTAGTNPSGFVLIKMNPAGTVVFNSTINMIGIHQFASMRLKGNKVVITGRSSNSYDAAIVAWDTAGNYLWSTTKLGQSGKDVEIDGSGNVLLLTSYPNQVSATSGQDIVIYKLNASGVQIWKKDFDFGGFDLPNRFTYVSNKLSVIAYGTSVSSLYTDWITFQVNNAGTKLWDVRYNGTSGNDEMPYFISAKANGEVFVTGKGGPTPVPGQLSYLRMITIKYGNTGSLQWIDSSNVYSGWGIASTLASDSSLFVLSGSYMTAFHFLDHTGTGSCGIPSTVNAINITDSSAKFTWSSVPGAYLYHLRYKTIGATTWTVISTNLTSKIIKTFTQGTSYNYAVEAVCSSGLSGFTTTQTFITTGAGYCTTGGQSTSQEFLNLVWIGSIQNSTGNNNGYADFTNLSTNITVGSTVSGYLRGTLGGAFTEYYSVWIDYNQNGSFTDAGELVANISSSSIGYNAISFTVPPTAALGATRMRVTMQFGSAPAPCGTYARGETEDYMVNIITPKMASSVNTENHEIKIYPNPVSDILFFENLNADESKTSVQVFDVTGKMVIDKIISDNKLDVGELNNGCYFIKAIQGKKIWSSKFLIEKS